MSKPNVDDFGWTAVPRNRSNIPSEDKAVANAVPVNFTEIWPNTPVVAKAQFYAKVHLPEETYNHSLRVYCFGHTILSQNFPSWSTPSFLETWALTCLFHDIGTTTSNLSATHMSFEFQGGFIALQELQSFGAPQAQAESVCEAIIRHQDPGDTGTISRMGQLVQICTELDNCGWQPHLVHKEVIEQVVEQHPRLKWSGCFSKTIGVEIESKPWCHTTALEGFREAVAGNEVMEPYD